jgi:hypothetical protein
MRPAPVRTLTNRSDEAMPVLATCTDANQRRILGAWPHASEIRSFHGCWKAVAS